MLSEVIVLLQSDTTQSHHLSIEFRLVSWDSDRVRYANSSIRLLRRSLFLIYCIICSKKCVVFENGEELKRIWCECAANDIVKYNLFQLNNFLCNIFCAKKSNTMTKVSHFYRESDEYQYCCVGVTL